MERFNQSGTMVWFRQMMRERESIIVNGVTYGLYSEYRDVVTLKMRTTLNGMQKNREVQNIGTTRNPLYMVMDPPKPPRYWHPRHIRPGGFREYVPEQQTAIGARHSLLMRWPAQARAELDRDKPRNAQLCALLEDALTVVEHLKEQLGAAQSVPRSAS
ncbi:MAG: hypothetical protein WCF04_13730 [Candidatus Nanopelagicales bacterium]